MTNEERFNLFDTYVESINGLPTKIKLDLPIIARYVFEANSGEVAPGQDVMTFAGIRDCLSIVNNYANNGELPTVEYAQKTYEDALASTEKIKTLVATTDTCSDEEAANIYAKYNAEELLDALNAIDIQEVTKAITKQINEVNAEKTRATDDAAVTHDDEILAQCTKVNQVISIIRQLKDAVHQLHMNIKAFSTVYQSNEPTKSTNVADLVGLKSFIRYVLQRYNRSGAIPEDTATRATNIIDNIYTLMTKKKETGKPTFKRFGYLDVKPAIDLVNLLPNLETSINEKMQEADQLMQDADLMMFNTRSKDDRERVDELREKYQMLQRQIKAMQDFSKPYKDLVSALKSLETQVNQYNDSKKRAEGLARMGDAVGGSGYEDEGLNYENAFADHLDDKINNISMKNHLETLKTLHQIIGNPAFDKADQERARTAAIELYNALKDYYTSQSEKYRNEYASDTEARERYIDLTNAEEYDRIMSDIENEVHGLLNDIHETDENKVTVSTSAHPSRSKLIFTSLLNRLNDIVSSITPADVATIVKLNKAIKLSKDANPNKDYRKLANQYFDQVGLSAKQIDPEKLSADSGYRYTAYGVTMPLKIAYELSKKYVDYHVDNETGAFVITENVPRKDGTVMSTWTVTIKLSDGWNVVVSVDQMGIQHPDQTVDTFGNNVGAALTAAFNQLV